MGRSTAPCHDARGFLTNDPAAVGRLNEHLRRKIEDHAAEIELARPDLQDGARTLLIAYGITARAMAEAVRHWRAAGRAVSALTVQTLWPAPAHALLHAVAGDDGVSGSGPRQAIEAATTNTAIARVVVAELNLGDLRREVERVIYRWAALNRRPAPEIIGINRVDGELITPEQFMAALI
jgi:2-oxoglutarate ferredoxin oxidoreductase subunit alpha